MTWVRYDDNVANHPKVEPLDDATYRLWREAIEWCARNLTDGIIHSRQLGLTSGRASPTRARKLVEQGLWHLAGAVCDSKQCPPSGKDGWAIHDYFDYQPTRDQVRQEQARAAERQRNWKARRRGNAVTDAVTDAVVNGTDNGVINAYPAPPRPAPKGRVGTDVPTAPPAAVGDGTAPGVEPDQPPPSQDPYGDEDPAAIAAEQRRLREVAAETARANANGAARSAAGAAAARAAIAERRARLTLEEQ